MTRGEEGVWDDMIACHSHTCAFNPDKFGLEVGLDSRDAIKLVERLCNILGATITGHGHREKGLFSGCFISHDLLVYNMVHNSASDWTPMAPL